MKRKFWTPCVANGNRMMVGIFLSIFAVAPAIAEWFNGKDADGLPYTYTVNDSGSLLGQWCNKDADACFWILATQRGCESGIDVPGILNTENGAVAISLKCLSSTVIDGKVYHRLLFSSFDTVQTALQGQKRVAIATPMQDVTYTVTRFNITGVDAATSRIDTAKRIYFETKSKKSTKDQKL